MGSHGKVFPVLGQKGSLHEGQTRAEPGSGVSGMAFYVYECYGDENGIHVWQMARSLGASY